MWDMRKYLLIAWDGLQMRESHGQSVGVDKYNNGTLRKTVSFCQNSK